jgi:hypothetical protein
MAAEPAEPVEPASLLAFLQPGADIAAAASKIEVSEIDSLMGCLQRRIEPMVRITTRAGSSVVASLDARVLQPTFAST